MEEKNKKLASKRRTPSNECTETKTKFSIHQNNTKSIIPPWLSIFFKIIFITIFFINSCYVVNKVQIGYQEFEEQKEIFIKNLNQSDLNDNLINDTNIIQTKEDNFQELFAFLKDFDNNLTQIILDIQKNKEFQIYNLIKDQPFLLINIAVFASQLLILIKQLILKIYYLKINHIVIKRNYGSKSEKFGSKLLNEVIEKNGNKLRSPRRSVRIANKQKNK